MLSAPATIQVTFTIGAAAAAPLTRDVVGDQTAQPSPLGQRHHRGQPRTRDQIRLVEHRGNRRRLWQSCTPRMPFMSTDVDLR